MKSPIFTKLNFSYKKSESDVWVLNVDDIPFDSTLILDQQIVHLGPRAFGGNHSHPRIEWFVAVGELQISWIDGNLEKHHRMMNPGGDLFLIEVPPHLPHVVVNLSDDKPGVLFEFADAKMSEVKTEEVL